jgi:hypothetical protein
MDGVIAGILEREAGQSEHQIGLFELAGDPPLAAPIASRFRLLRGSGRHAAEEAFGHVDDPAMVHIACGGQHHLARRVFPRQEGADRRLVEAFDGVRRAEDRASDGLAREGGFHEGVVDQVVGRVLDGGVFLQDHALFAGELPGIEGGIDEDVAEHVESDIHVLAEDAGGVARVFDARRGVDVAAHILDVFGDLARGAAGRALERHVLDEMRQAVFMGTLVP